MILFNISPKPLPQKTIKNYPIHILNRIFINGIIKRYD